MRRLFVLAAVALLASTAVLAQPWSDNFDSYSNGQNLHGVGGWLGWDGDALSTGFVTNAQAFSTPYSLAIDGTGPGANVSDLVQELTTPGTGIYNVHADTFFPSGSTGVPMFIMLNTYTIGNGQPKNWSSTIAFDHATGLLTDIDSAVTSGSTAIIYDQWVGMDMEINLDSDTFGFEYNGVSLYTGQPWSQTGNVDIGAIDLWSNNADVMYYDNIWVQVVPEPASMIALGAGAIVLLRRRRRKTS